MNNAARLADLTPEQQRWQVAGRQYSEQVVRPVVTEWDSIVQPTDVPSIELIRQASSFGLRTLTIPANLGGQGADALSHCLVLEEVAAADVGTAIMLSQVYRWTPIISVAMNEEQRGRFLPRMLRDEAYFVAGAMTEPGVGSDNQMPTPDPAVGIQSSAVRDGNGWILNGQKHFINGGGCASLYAVLVRTDRTVPAHEGCTYFVVPADHPGFRVVRLHDKMSGRLGALAELELKDCRVSDADRLGEVNKGFEHQSWRLLGRLIDAAICCGVIREALRLGVSWASERDQGGRKLIEHQAVAMLVAETGAELEAARALTWQAARAVDRQDDDAFYQVCAAKHFAAEAGFRAARRTLEVYGGYGIMRDWPVEKLYRDAATLAHIGGTQQMILLRMAQELQQSYKGNQ